MTIEELQRAAQSLTFAGGLRLLSPTVAVIPDPGGVYLRLTIVVPDRDAPNGDGPLIPVLASIGFSHIELERVIGSALSFIREQLVKFILHEIDESLLFDGKRVFDPHPPEPIRVHVHNCPIIPGRNVDQFGLPCPDKECRYYYSPFARIVLPPTFKTANWYSGEAIHTEAAAEYLLFIAKKSTRPDPERNELRTWWEWECEAPPAARP